MRQKLGIVQAFQHDPELAILDEPTEGLDPLMQRSFYDILDDRREPAEPSSSRRTSCPRSSGSASAWPSSATASWWRSATWPSCWRDVAATWSCASPATPPDLAGVPGISDVHVGRRVLSCQLEGDPGPSSPRSRACAIHDLLIEPARLEEAFMEYYADDGDDLASSTTSETAVAP